MSASPGRILVVDDDGAIRDVLSEYFKGKGYAVETAPDGAEALALVPEWRPDIVLLDVCMPGLDGVEVLRCIRAVDEGLPVIMVTADEDVNRARESVKLGAFEYVAKPFDFARLDQTVGRALLQSTARPTAARSATVGVDGAGDPSGAWKALAIAAFRTARQMGPGGRDSMGARIESAALAAACEATGGHAARAAEALRELRLLVTIAAELGDLPPSARTAMEAAMAAVRTSPPPPG